MQKQVYEYISQQTKDPIVEWKTCRVSGTQFPIYKSDLEFYDKISPTFNGKKYQIPTPTLCPDLRHMRRMLFRNDRSLYRKTCDGTGKNIICMFAPDKPYKVYERELRRSDNRSAFDYGINFDFTKTFNEQFNTLLLEVPLPSLLNSNSHNSSYVNQTGNMKNSYLMFSCMDSENCYYGNRIFSSVYCVDCSVIYDSQNCYECSDGHNLYECFFCRNTDNSSNCYFMFDCVNCKNCFGCWNLRNKEYCIYNKQYTKQEYEKEINKLKKMIMSYKELSQLRKDFNTTINEKALFRSMYLDNCEKTFGGFLYDSKNTIECYEGGELEYCKYGLMLHNAKNVQDGNNSTGAQRQYEVSTGGIEGYNVLFSLDARPQNSYVLYSAYCPNSNHLFGCVGLKNASYCIFNKQYTKEEYEKLVSKIIEHMQKTGERGEFFDPSISPFGYNESAAFEYFPIDKEQARQRNIPWYRPPQKNSQENNYLAPDNIEDTNDDILERILSCEMDGSSFRIIKQELDFYKKYGIAIPRISPNSRHINRFNKKPSRKLQIVICKNCGKEITSIHSSNNSRKVYCESCYNKEIYG